MDAGMTRRHRPPWSRPSRVRRHRCVRSFRQAAAAMVHCAWVFCQAGSARNAAYQRVISP